jgi:hypothetical protein
MELHGEQITGGVKLGHGLTFRVILPVGSEVQSYTDEEYSCN